MTKEELGSIVNLASRYSPWAATTAASCYITAPGGHRIGMCGEAVIQEGRMRGIRQVNSLCIRIARDIPGIAKELRSITGSILIIGSPGSGKTTLLRDLIRYRNERHSVSVVDERGELFPKGVLSGPRIDVLTGCSKVQGVELLLRTMSPGTIAVDEITAAEDCNALIKAGWCGVDLLATAHASSRTDLHSRPVYAPLVKSHLFETLIVLRSDKSWKMERMERCT